MESTVELFEHLKRYKHNACLPPAPEDGGTTTGDVMDLAQAVLYSRRRILLRTAPVGLFTLVSSLLILVPFGRGKAAGLFSTSGVWLLRGMLAIGNISGRDHRC